MVGSNRIIRGTKIVNPLGNADLDPQDEKELRRAILKKALEALHAHVKEQTLFD
jgi:betaine reductase